ncbi:DUF6801 domain-containing protein [Actinokineospora sp. G85]|uniref:DUF6801 domain-containing protein n=1 Tax=Actinokineospora sp. G85 TaxID=3406626 RepID=UPI003C77E4C2
MRRKVSKKVLAGAAATTAAGLVATGLLLGSGTSNAQPVSLTLNYSCPFPLIGEKQIKAVINTDLPLEIGVGEPTGAFQIEAITTVPADATQGLSLVGSATIEGTALASATVTTPDLTLPVNVPITVPKTNVPASGAFDIAAFGETPSLSFQTPGQATITIGELKLNLHPKRADGTDTGLGVFDSQCKLVPGQNTTLATFQINPGPTTQPPTSEPTEPPTSEPTEPPTSEPTEPPTSEPTEPPTSEPTEPPTSEPTEPPTSEPTEPPTSEPTEPPTSEPTEPPTSEPTEPPTSEPTEPPTSEPTEPPTSEPPTSEPTEPPTSEPTEPPTSEPTQPPTSTTPPPNPGTNVNFGVDGSSKLKGLNGTVPLHGSFAANADLAKGTYTGDLKLKSTTGRFRIFGFVPVGANIAFDQVGQPSGTISRSSVTFSANLDIKLTKVSLFGFSIYQGDTCKTAEPAAIELKSSGKFDVTKGGTLKGKYSLSETVNCGPLTPIIGAFVASDGNTVNIKLAPKK